LILPK